MVVGKALKRLERRLPRAAVAQAEAEAEGGNSREGVAACGGCDGIRRRLAGFELAQPERRERKKEGRAGSAREKRKGGRLRGRRPEEGGDLDQEVGALEVELTRR